MNAIDRWKIVLTLIAIFVAGAVTVRIFTIRAMKYEMPRRSEAPPPETPFSVDRWLAHLHLTPDQDQKLRPMIEQADNELRNLRALDLREIEGILDRAQDRMNPVLQPDQQQRLRRMVEERKHHLEQSFNVLEPHLP
jgi:Spy/CpxP family protein refolding chaperone